MKPALGALLALFVASGSSSAHARGFFDALALDELRVAPIEHAGRLAPLDTVARQLVHDVSGRETIDVRTGDGDLVEVDALVAFLEWALAPDRAADDPIIPLETLRTRDAVARALSDDAATRVERRGMATPREIAIALDDQLSNEATLLPDLSDAERRLMAWLRVDDVLADHDASELARAWRDRDAHAVRAAGVRLASTMQDPIAPAWRMRLEVFMNERRPFALAMWLYAAGAAGLLLTSTIRRRAPAGVSYGLAAGAAAMHALALVGRGLVAQRLPLQNQYESLVALAFGAAVVGLVWGGLRGARVIGAAGAACAAIALLVAEHAGVPGGAVQPEAPILGTASLLKYHVTAMIAAYAVIAVGGVLGAASLCARMSTTARDLRQLDGAVASAVRLSFWLLGVGILFGAWWADRAWGRWWAFDAKETWALITWLVYLIGVHLPGAGGMSEARRAARTAALAVAGLACMLWTYFGVNLLMTSLHAYA